MQQLIHVLKTDKFALASVIFLALLAVLGLLVPLVPGLDPNYFNPNLLLEPAAPNWQHWFGTDDLNRDILLRAIYGGRISLLVGLMSISISVSVGTLYGLVAGYRGGMMDQWMMRFVDVMLAIPSIFLILSLQIILGPNMVTVVLVIGFTSWMGIARLVRAEVLSIKSRPFVVAAKARGIGTLSLLGKYILPHAISPVIVAATLGVGGAILAESVLSFLGLGVQPPHASWGNMLENSLAFMGQAPWMSIVPGVLITLTVLAFNFLGDAIQKVIGR
ncbi:MAG: ABC transporter permease [bacterium]|nr:ABC transporter permease [bacterium]